MRALFLLSFLFFGSCSSFTRDNDQIDSRLERLKSKQEEYLRCVRILNREGVKQMLLQSLCDATYKN